MNRFQQVQNVITGKMEKELPRHLSYHNIDHTRDVMQAAAAMAGTANIDESSNELLLTAALFHDSGFLNTRDGHEEESCKIARHYLPMYNYSAAEIEVICNLIMATRIPQSPKNELEKILCDADLDYLGRDDFFELSSRLFAELKAEGIIKDEDEWNRQQADFMGSHRYFTQIAVNLRQPMKEHYIELIRSKIATQIFNEKR